MEKSIHPIAKMEHQQSKRTFIIRWSFFTIGLIILALGIALTIKGEKLGIGPWDVFHVGLYEKFGLTVGSWSIIAGVIIVAITSIAWKQWPQFGTILNMFLLGVFIDIFLLILPNPDTMLMMVLCFVTGVIILAYGIGIYVAPELGAGPRDGLMLLIHDVTGWKVQWVRNGIEITVFLLGWMLGGPVGIGTVIIAFFLGTLVGYTLPQSKKWLDYCIQRGEQNENINKRSIRSDNHDRVSQKVR
ncbi:YczE/YyaS/YitT family protein [Pontibacillus litoralis]|uniref:Membrane protein n=1 Tax=Pontibacillus litoralis JSM 072002 TaxID=1385512 RepID=A0A0A5GCR2_9BACI|nr:YitT family protein [Pontibacillus litoralis]KGX88978.1 membrane protein [Pontibacillus litoralis JSM 072002]